MPVCTLEHHVLYYQTSGSPSPDVTLLFIHGSGANVESWRKQMNDLPPEIQGIALDLPGHGRSTGPALNRVTELAEIIAEFIRQLAPPHPLILVGHSLGAAIALQAASLNPPAIDGVILIGGGARMRVLPAFLEGLAAGLADPGFFRLAFAPQADPALVEEELTHYAEVSADLLFQDFTACNEFDMIDELASVAVPALLIVGEHDRLTPLKNSRFLEDNLTRAQLMIIPDAGHFAMLEKPGLVNQAIQQFLRQLKTSTLD